MGWERQKATIYQFINRITLRERNQGEPHLSIVVELEAHAIMNLVILEGDVVLVDGVPLLNPDLLGPSTRLRGDKLLQVADCVVIVALHSDLLPQTVVQHHLNHLRN